MKEEKLKNILRKKERGQSLMEVAISLPVIILLLAGTLDFGMAIFSYIILRDAAQEGALYGSVDPVNVNEIENRTRSISPQDPENLTYSPVDLNNKDLVKVTIKFIGNNCQGLTDNVSNSLQVSVSFDYPVFMPFAGSVLGSATIPLNATATNVILQPACP